MLFMDLLKKYSCLWKVKSKDYKKRYIKYASLISVCSEMTNNTICCLSPSEILSRSIYLENVWLLFFKKYVECSCWHCYIISEITFTLHNQFRKARCRMDKLSRATLQATLNHTLHNVKLGLDGPYGVILELTIVFLRSLWISIRK